ncbi:MAG TPA: bifunctional diguanylate cyclase/phosphodiesterase [Mycobacteriales bacterium]|jgi:diguanylate cyclase (GGDEF)-like protein|nr:bifunctional diguanylate cyclase/phosphodiesterase [Mycobacteriales bacterium]
MAKHARQSDDEPADFDVRQLEQVFATLGEAVAAAAVLLLVDGSDAVHDWVAEGTGREVIDRATDYGRQWLAGEQQPGAPRTRIREIDGWQLLVNAVSTTERQRYAAIVVVRSTGQVWSPADHHLVETTCRLCGFFAEAIATTCGGLQRRLDELVTLIATELMPVSAATIGEAYRHTLEILTEFFSLDASVLRRHDHERGFSVLEAEWPIRPNVPDPDPLGTVSFDDADSVFAASRNLREPLVIRPDVASSDYQERVRAGSGIAAVSVAAVPLIRSSVTQGVLGFIKFGDRAWSDSEINALRAIASLLVQLQARVKAEEQLQINAYHDELTGLDNRRSFLERLGASLADRRARPLALFFLDLDRLKTMNDFLGHGAGDRFLRALAGRLRESVRADDFVARLGGDEFVILAGGIGDLDDALRIGQTILSAVGAPIDVGGHPISRSASIGVAIGYPGETTVDQLMQHADVALLEAKARGRGVIQPFNEKMRAKVEARAEIELHLPDAISSGALRVVYQPEFDLRNGNLLAVEALVRWQHPVRGLLDAEEFIDIAEETNTIIELGRWVLAQACRQLAAWQSQYPQLQLQLRVNVSPAQLISKDFVANVAQQLTAFGLSGEQLCLEITERAVFPDLEPLLSTLRDLRSIGVAAAIDDFGTGFSSLAQLKTLPVDTLKIDRSFVAGVGLDIGDTAIVESIAQLARTLDLQIVAEGVESVRAVRELLRIGCHRAQGNLLGHAFPAEQLAPILAGQRLNVELLES